MQFSLVRIYIDEKRCNAEVSRFQVFTSQIHKAGYFKQSGRTFIQLNQSSQRKFLKPTACVKPQFELDLVSTEPPHNVFEVIAMFWLLLGNIFYICANINTLAQNFVNMTLRAHYAGNIYILANL